MRVADSTSGGLQPRKTCCSSDETVLDLFASVGPSASSLHLPSLFLHHLLQPWPSPCKQLPARDTWRGRNLQSEVWRRASFSHSERLGGCTGKRGAARAWKCQCGLEIQARLPGSASSSSFIHYEERNGSHVTLLNINPLFLCRGQRV